MIDLRDIAFWIVAAALLLASEYGGTIPTPLSLWNTVSYGFACQNMTPPDCTEPLPSL